MRKTAVVLFAVLSGLACGLPTGKSTGSTSSTGGSGGSSGSCTLTTTFNTVGQLGEIQFTQSSGQPDPSLSLLIVQVADYQTTCGGENLPPSYSAQNYWHGVGFRIEGSTTNPPYTVNYPGVSGGPSFEGCSFGDGVGGDGPVGLACGGSFPCVEGSSVTISAASPTSASGSYNLTLDNGTGSTIGVSGDFSITSNCQGL